MAESVITFLIYLCLLAVLVYLAIWVIRDVLGVPIPERVIQILWVVVALVVILWFFRMVLPHITAIPGFR
jgi:hypothetical protein